MAEYNKQYFLDTIEQNLIDNGVVRIKVFRTLLAELTNWVNELSVTAITRSSRLDSTSEFSVATSLAAKTLKDITDDILMALEDKLNISDLPNTLAYTDAINNFSQSQLLNINLDSFTDPKHIINKEYYDRDMDIIKNIISDPYNYSSPTVSITNVTQYVEHGSALTINITISFTQRDAGALTGYSLEKDNVGISNTQTTQIILTDINATVVFKGYASYNEGPVIDDNLGIPTPGNIQAGTVGSSTRNIIPTYRNFLGTSTLETLNSNQIIALERKDLDTNRARSYSDITAGAGNYLFYAYPANYGDLTNLVLDGSSSVFGSITKLPNVLVTNQYGYPLNYNVYRTNAKDAFTNSALNFI